MAASQVTHTAVVWPFFPSTPTEPSNLLSVCKVAINSSTFYKGKLSIQLYSLRNPERSECININKKLFSRCNSFLIYCIAHLPTSSHKQKPERQKQREPGTTLWQTRWSSSSSSLESQMFIHSKLGKLSNPEDLHEFIEWLFPRVKRIAGCKSLGI